MVKEDKWGCIVKNHLILSGCYLDASLVGGKQPLVRSCRTRTDGYKVDTLTFLLYYHQYHLILHSTISIYYNFIISLTNLNTPTFQYHQNPHISTLNHRTNQPFIHLNRSNLCLRKEIMIYIKSKIRRYVIKLLKLGKILAISSRRSKSR